MADDARCCDAIAHGCRFAKALLAQAARCDCATRSSIGERQVIECRSATAHAACCRYADRLHERARFALKLPPPGRPVLHLQALRLQCGGVAALHQAAGEPAPASVHRLVMAAESAEAGLDGLPWPDLVARIAAWRPVRRHPPTR